MVWGHGTRRTRRNNVQRSTVGRCELLPGPVLFPQDTRVSRVPVLFLVNARVLKPWVGARAHTQHPRFLRPPTVYYLQPLLCGIIRTGFGLYITNFKRNSTHVSRWFRIEIFTFLCKRCYRSYWEQCYSHCHMMMMIGCGINVSSNENFCEDQDYNFYISIFRTKIQLWFWMKKNRRFQWLQIQWEFISTKVYKLELFLTHDENGFTNFIPNVMRVTVFESSSSFSTWIYFKVLTRARGSSYILIYTKHVRFFIFHCMNTCHAAAYLVHYFSHHAFVQNSL